METLKNYTFTEKPIDDHNQYIFPKIRIFFSNFGKRAKEKTRQTRQKVIQI